MNQFSNIPNRSEVPFFDLQCKIQVQKKEWFTFYSPGGIYTACVHYIWIKTKNWREQKKKAWLCERYTQRQAAGVMAVHSPQSQIGDWNKKCYQISFLILFIYQCLHATGRPMCCYCFGKWWLVSGFGWKCHKKWQLALSELFTYGINHVERRNLREWLSAVGSVTYTYMVYRLCRWNNWRKGRNISFNNIYHTVDA